VATAATAATVVSTLTNVPKEATSAKITCSCDNGFTLDGDGAGCTDINECEEMRTGFKVVPCDTNASFTN
jgi:hypothetical protein